MKQKKSALIGFEEFLSWQHRYKKTSIPKAGTSADEAKVYGFLEHNETRIRKIIKLFQKTLPQIKNYNSSTKTIESLQENITNQRLQITEVLLDKNFSGKKLMGQIFDTFFDLK